MKPRNHALSMQMIPPKRPDPEVWIGIEQALSEQSRLTNSMDVEQVYIVQFLEEIYPK